MPHGLRQFTKSSADSSRITHTPGQRMARLTSWMRCALVASTIDDDAHIHQVVRRVSKGRRTTRCAGPLRCRIRCGDVAAGALGTTRDLEPPRHSRTARLACPGAVGELLSRMAGHRTRTSGVGLHHARIDRKALGTDQPLSHAALKHRLEDMAQGIAFPKATMAVLGEGRVLGYRVLKSQPAEPPVRQIQMHLLAEPALGTDPEAVPHRTALAGASART